MHTDPLHHIGMRQRNNTANVDNPNLTNSLVVYSLNYDRSAYVPKRCKYLILEVILEQESEKGQPKGWRKADCFFNEYSKGRG